MGSNPTSRATTEPTALLEFERWLLEKKGNREATIVRKLKFFKRLSGSPEEMSSQILRNGWTDKVKSNGLDVVYQYAEFIGQPMVKVKFRVFDNREVYVPNPDMVKAFLYRVTLNVRARIMIAVQTGACAGEVWWLTWSDFNPQNRTLNVVGVKGHRTSTYKISEELVGLLQQIPRKGTRIFSNVAFQHHMNDRVIYHAKLLAQETGNQDYAKIHFHTFRHFAISWQYFKTKDIVETQRFARHCNINNTLKYVHIVKAWIKENEFEVVYAEDKVELTKYLSEGYALVTKTDWGFCLTKPKEVTALSPTT